MISRNLSICSSRFCSMPCLHSFETNAALAEHNTGMFKRRNDLSLGFLGARQGAGHAFEAANRDRELNSFYGMMTSLNWSSAETRSGSNEAPKRRSKTPGRSAQLPTTTTSGGAKTISQADSNASTKRG
jgi:hypothetical protein